MQRHGFWASKRMVWALLGGILVAGTALRLYGLADESFWFDEAYSVWVARHSVAWHIALSTQRIFPPLYYLMLHFWLALGSSDFAVRGLSVLIGVLSIVAIYALANELFDERVGLLSAFLLTISPLHIWYSQEARMYILVAALGLCSAYFMLLALRRGKPWHWLAYVLSTALAMNAHYFSVFLVPFQNAFVGYLLLKKRVRPDLWKPWLASQVAVGLLSVIGLAGIFSSESSYWWGLLDTWHGAPTWRDLASLLVSFSLGTTTQGGLLLGGIGGLALFGFCAVWSLFRVKEQRWSLALDDGIVFVLLYLCVPLGTVFALSQVQSFWVLRYIFPFLPPYCIIVACGIRHMPGRLLRIGAVVIITLASLWSVANAYRYEQKENWRAATQYITAQERPGDVIMLLDEDIWLPFEHYYHGPTRREGVSRVITDQDLLAARVGMLLPSYSRIWLVISHSDNLALKEYLRMSPHTSLVEEKLFTLIEVDLFEIHDR